MGALFHFVQFEFTHAIGPHEGRYVVADDAATGRSGAADADTAFSTIEKLVGVTMKPGTADVLVINVASAPPSRSRVRRRTTEEGSADKERREVPLLLATFIQSTRPAADERAASRALDAIARDEDARQAWVHGGLEVVNRAVRGYRAGARDPYITEVTERDARRIRIGFGTADDVANGSWRRAIALPPPIGIRVGRVERLAPAEATADVLAGRGAVLEAEDVLLRAYVDLDQGRIRAAALQVRAAVELLEIELGERGASAPGDFEELAERASAIVSAALQPPDGDGTDADSVSAVESLVGSVERVVERWRHAGAAL